MTSLTDLPTELVQGIAQMLVHSTDSTEQAKLDDLFALRLTCKDIASKSHHTFVNAGFGKRTVSLTRKGVLALRYIYSIPVFAKAVRNIVFERNEVSEEVFGSLNNMTFMDAHSSRRKQSTLHRMLKYAFKRFPNLEEVTLTKPLRMCDGPLSHLDSLSTSLAMAILGVIAAAQPPKLRKLDLSPAKTQPLSFKNAIYYTALAYLDPKGFENLEEIVLQLCMEKELPGQSERGLRLGGLPRFLSPMTALTRLDITLDRTDRAEEIMENVLCIHWPHLSVLKLQNMSTTDDELDKFLVAHKQTLRSVTLIMIDLLAEPDMPWIRIIESLSTCPELEELILFALQANDFRVMIGEHVNLGCICDVCLYCLCYFECRQRDAMRKELLNLLDDDKQNLYGTPNDPELFPMIEELDFDTVWQRVTRPRELGQKHDSE